MTEIIDITQLKKIKARGRKVKHQNGQMNKTEERYANECLRGKYDSYFFERIKLRLADTTFYTPDFMAITHEGYIEFHEVKGYWEDDARVKIKVAAEQYSMFNFKGAIFDSKQKKWKMEQFS